MTVFTDREVLLVASSAVRSEIRASHVQLRREGDFLHIEVQGEGKQAALARCEAVVRAGMRALDEANEPPWLEAWRSDAHRRITAWVLDLRDVWPAIEEPARPAEKAAWAKLFAKQLRRSETIPAIMLDEIEAQTLQLLQQHWLEAEKELDRLDVSGKGMRHPERVAAKRRRDGIRSWFFRQKQEEADAFDILVEAWTAQRVAGVAEGRAWTQAFDRARLKYVDQSASVEAAAFLAPIRLRLLAFEHALQVIEEEVLSLRFGDRHPSRVVLRDRIDAIRKEFEQVRAHHVLVPREQQNVGKPSHERATATTTAADDPRIELRRKRDEALHLILELERRTRAAEQATPRVRVRGQCALTSKRAQTPVETL